MNVVIRFILSAGIMVALTRVAGLSQVLRPSEVGGSYLYTHTNAPPGGCGCFGMNGAGGWIASDVTDNVAIVGEASVQHATNVLHSGADLSVTSYTAGPRYSWRKFVPIAPFGQALFGGAHASGSYYAAGNGKYGSNSFAMTVGGGLDVPVNERWAIRVIETDYYLTHFANSLNDHQNNLRIAGGVTLRLGPY